MKLTPLLFVGLLLISGFVSTSAHPAESPDFKWWQDARFGMFIHWGPSTLSGKEISWSRAKSNPNSPNNGPTPVEVYDTLYRKFNPVKFNADDWVAAAKAAGMKYMVLTAKHCDGFMLWDTKTGDYNIMKTPFGRDVVSELSKAAARGGIPFCVYFAPGDWKDPDCRNPSTNAKFVERMHAQITELLTRYGKIPLIWFDFDGYPNPSDPKETATLVRKLQPGIIMTNRLEALHSDESHGRIGSWGDYATPEQFVGGYCDKMPWETCMTIGGQWSWRPDEKVKSLKQCLTTLLSTVGGDGNLLFNVGPKPDGEIEPLQVARLKEMGAWLARNGEAVYGTRGGPYYPCDGYACTRNSKAIYISSFKTDNGTLRLPALPAKVISATLLEGTAVPFEQTDKALKITIPQGKEDPNITVVKLIVEGDPMKIPAIFPHSTSGSLAYRKPARVSSSIAPDFIHSPQSALDDDPSTCWTPGRNESLASGYAGKKFEHLQKLHNHKVWQHGGWLEVDLGAPATLACARLSEKGGYSPVTSWKIEYEKNGVWKTAAEGTKIGKSLDVPFAAPVTSGKLKLTVEASGRCAISEFQLFPVAPQH